MSIRRPAERPRISEKLPAESRNRPLVKLANASLSDAVTGPTAPGESVELVGAGKHPTLSPMTRG
jgi:hypothetical protein